MTLVRTSNRNYPSFPSFFNHLMGDKWMDWTNSNYSDTNTSLPAVNIRENDNDYLIEVAAPGMSKNDFKVNLDNDTLTISSDKKDEGLKKDECYTKREFSYQSFQRTFSINERVVDGEKIEAKYENGILTIQLPKKEEVKPKSRKIEVS